MIGSNVYGLRETPFLNADSAPCAGSNCSYRFEAQAAALRSSRTYLVRDLAWDAEGRGGAIRFAPAFNSITALPEPPGAPAPPTTNWYEIKGTDFWQILGMPQFGLSGNCLFPAGACGYPRLYAYQDNGTENPLIPDPDPGYGAIFTILANPHLRVVDPQTLRIVFQSFPPRRWRLPTRRRAHRRLYISCGSRVQQPSRSTGP